MKNLNETTLPKADFAVVLGSGYGFDNSLMTELMRISFLPFLPISASAVFSSDDGGIFWCDSYGKTILVFEKRIHRYQGFSPFDTVLPVRIAKQSGAKIVILSNAAGGLKEEQRIGQFMIIDKHIVVEPVPSISPEINSDIIREIDSPYNPELSEILYETVKALAADCLRGTYAQVPGPAYETWSEVDYLRSLGADAVGMSTALEAVWAHLNGMKVVALSLLTNVHSRRHTGKLTHEEILENSKASQAVFMRILNKFMDLSFQTP